MFLWQTPWFGDSYSYLVHPLPSSSDWHFILGVLCKCAHTLLKVSPPEDSDTRLIIDKMASFVAEGGTELERKAKEDYKDNPVFS